MLRFLPFILVAASSFAAPELIDDSVIRIETAGDVQQTREALITAIWGDHGFPAEKLPQFKPNVDLPFPELADTVVSSDELVCPLDLGLRSTAVYLHPRAPRNRLAIYHQGHGHDVLDAGGRESIRFFLENGYDVLAFWMPLFGPNRDTGEPPMTKHDELIERAASLPTHPLRLFLEPVIAALNLVMTQHPWDQVVMIGISGGGWTTTMIAAIDPRVQVSFPVAGTMPLYTRSGGSIGDHEQYAEEIYSVAGYPDLYILGAFGEERMQVQILNHEDPCCFSVKSEPEYVAQVQARLSVVGPGVFRFHIDTSHGEHRISDHAIEAFVRPALRLDPDEPAPPKAPPAP